MTERRLFVEAADWSPDEIFVRGEQAHHLKDVLRARPGAEFEFIDGQGRWARAAIAGLPARGEIRCRIQEQKSTSPPPETRLVLMQALIRFEKFEWILEKATELGATRIVPVITAHTEAKWRELSDVRWERWRKILIESIKQCRRLDLPALARPLRFDNAIRASQANTRLILSEKMGAPSFKSVSQARLSNPKEGSSALADQTVTVVIGPEGGWSADEIAFAGSCGYSAVSLGDAILRAETAAIAALAIARHEFLDDGSRAEG